MIFNFFNWLSRAKTFLNYASFMYFIVRYHTYIICNATVSADITGKRSPIKLDICFEIIDISIGLSQPNFILALKKMKVYFMYIS